MNGNWFATHITFLPRLLLPPRFCLLRVSFIHEVNIKQQQNDTTRQLKQIKLGAIAGDSESKTKRQRERERDAD